MNITIIGASGMIGSRVLAEALLRGHQAVAVVRNTEKIAPQPRLRILSGDARDATSVAQTSARADVVISAYGPGAGDQNDLLKTADALLTGLRQAGVPRVIVVGGAGGLEIAPGMVLLDSPHFPEMYKPVATSQKASLDIFRAAKNDAPTWTYVSPAAEIVPGKRTTAFRIGGDQLLVDDNGKSRISAEDFAIALIDEAERPQHPNRQITVAY
jgi:putative NADH-flavin reductase